MSRKKKTCLRQIGITEDGKPVLAGVYKAYETYGVPLEVLLVSLEESGAIPCWNTLYDEAKAAGMKHERIKSMLAPAISDSYGPDLCEMVLLRLESRRI